MNAILKQVLTPDDISVSETQVVFKTGIVPLSLAVSRLPNDAISTFVVSVTPVASYSRRQLAAMPGSVIGTLQDEFIGSYALVGQNTMDNDVAYTFQDAIDAAAALVQIASPIAGTPSRSIAKNHQLLEVYSSSPNPSLISGLYLTRMGDAHTQQLGYTGFAPLSIPASKPMSQIIAAEGTTPFTIVGGNIEDEYLIGYEHANITFTLQSSSFHSSEFTPSDFLFDDDLAETFDGSMIRNMLSHLQTPLALVKINSLIMWLPLSLVADVKFNGSNKYGSKIGPDAVLEITYRVQDGITILALSKVIPTAAYNALDPAGAGTSLGFANRTLVAPGSLSLVDATSGITAGGQKVTFHASSCPIAYLNTAAKATLTQLSLSGFDTSL